MTVQEVARGVMKVTKTSQQEVANRAGLTGQSTVSMFLQSKSMRVDNFLMILNACGYELVARSSDGKLPEFLVGEKQSAGKEAEETDDNMAEMIRRLVAEEVSKAVGTESKKRKQATKK